MKKHSCNRGWKILPKAKGLSKSRWYSIRKHRNSEISDLSNTWALLTSNQGGVLDRRLQSPKANKRW